MVLAMAGWWFLSCQGDVVDHPKGAAVTQHQHLEPERQPVGRAGEVARCE